LQVRRWWVFPLLLPPLLAAVPTKRPTDEERGRELWVRHCQSCHGVQNRGDGAATTSLVVPVPDLLGKVKVDEATIKVVLRGKVSMPAFEQSFDEPDARRVLGYQAKLGAEPARVGEPPADQEPAEQEPAEQEPPEAAPAEG
jgi:mono/diheme cytochrome c family protein